MSAEHAHDITSARSLEAADRAHRALELRRARKTYRAIGKEIGVSATQAFRYVSEALAEMAAETKESAVQLRAIEVEALNRLEAQLAERLDGRPAPDDADFAKLAAALVRVSESRRKLQGLDAPQKVEVSGNTYTVKEASPDCEAWGKPPAATKDE